MNTEAGKPMPKHDTPEHVVCEIARVMRTETEIPLVHFALGTSNDSGYSALTVMRTCTAAQAREFGRALIAQADALDEVDVP